jgi:hypothetical protein
MRGSLTLLALAAFVSAVPARVAAQTLTTAEAANHVGETATVCGDIAGEHTATSSHGTPTFINLDKPYPHQVFTLLIWGDDKQNVGQFPTSGRVCATGKITEYHGAPEIVLRDAHSWSVPK